MVNNKKQPSLGYFLLFKLFYYFYKYLRSIEPNYVVYVQMFGNLPRITQNVDGYRVPIQSCRLKTSENTLLLQFLHL